jgi:hemin uptake protein HemP
MPKQEAEGTQPGDGAGPTPPPPEPRPQPLRSEVLLRGRRLVEITHNGETYRLQVTRQGKLILTK